MENLELPNLKRQILDNCKMKSGIHSFINLDLFMAINIFLSHQEFIKLLQERSGRTLLSKDDLKSFKIDHSVKVTFSLLHSFIIIKKLAKNKFLL